MPSLKILKTLKVCSIVISIGSVLSMPYLYNLEGYSLYPAIIMLMALTIYVFSVMLEVIDGS